jgi:hypothetical protein
VDIRVEGFAATPAGLISLLLALAGVWALARAEDNERRMQRHRRPGVSYREVTLRRDGAWRRSDLFAPEGLAYQRQASKWGVTGALLLLLAVFFAWLAGR